jgi:hypothetical protein
LTPLAENTTYVLAPPGEPDFDIPTPYIFVDVNWGTANLSVEVVAVSGNSTKAVPAIGQLEGFPLPYVSRFFSGDIWYGLLADGTFAPPGRYKIVQKMLRIFGDASKEEDWEVIESLPFKIEYA